MKSLNKSGRVLRVCAGFLCIMLSGIFIMAQAPSHTMKFSPVIDANINGFWEYLPRNYALDVNQKYPLIIFLHGYGDSGSTPDTTTLNMVLNAGTPKIIKNGTFPDSFYVSGKWYKFIVISPQIKDGYNLNPVTIDALINYANNSYRVDNTRIYLCGISMGGGITWTYPGSSEAAAEKLAAIAVAAGTAALDTTATDNIAEAYLPVLATHNLVDDIVPVTTTIGNIDKVKKSKKKVKDKNKPDRPAVDPDPLVFYWATPGLDPGNILNNHNVWSRTFEDILPGITLGGNLRDQLGYNVYEWMLQYTRSSAATLPVIWQDFSVTKVNRNILLRWTTSHELNLKSYVVEKSNDGKQWSAIATLLPSQNTSLSKEYSFADTEPFSGLNYYRIKELDKDEKATYSVTKQLLINSSADKVKIFPNPFDNQVTFSFSNSAATSYVIVKVTDSRGAVWRNEKHNVQSGNIIISLKNLQGLGQGLYYITITNEQGKIIGKEKIIKN